MESIEGIEGSTRRLNIWPNGALEKEMWGRLGGSVREASGFGSCHGLSVLGSSPALGSLLSRESASPSAAAPHPLLMLELSLK